MNKVEEKRLSTSILFQSWVEQFGFIVENLRGYAIPDGGDDSQAAALMLVEASKYILRVSDLTRALETRDIFPTADNMATFCAYDADPKKNGECYADDGTNTQAITVSLTFLKQFTATKKVREEWKAAKTTPPEDDLTAYQQRIAKQVWASTTFDDKYLKTTRYKDVAKTQSTDFVPKMFSYAFEKISSAVFSYIVHESLDNAEPTKKACFKTGDVAIEAQCMTSLDPACVFPLDYPTKTTDLYEYIVSDLPPLLQ